MSGDTTARNGRDWTKITALALVPTLAAGLVALMLDGSPQEASAATVPSSTTTTRALESESGGSDADDHEVSFSPADQDAAQDEDEAGAPAQGPESETEDPEPPAPAELELPVEVEATGNSAGIEVANTGELPLEIFLVDVNGNPIEVGEMATEVKGGSTETIGLTIDTTDLAFGPYQMTVSISTSDGVGHVEVKGAKLAVLIPLLPDLDISDVYVVPHQANLLEVKVANNEAHAVTVGLSSDDDRLGFPGELELAPGDNTITVTIQPLAVQWNVIDVLHLKVSYGSTEMGTVTITKYGS